MHTVANAFQLGVLFSLGFLQKHNLNLHKMCSNTLMQRQQHPYLGGTLVGTLLRCSMLAEHTNGRHLYPFVCAACLACTSRGHACNKKQERTAGCHTTACTCHNGCHAALPPLHWLMFAQPVLFLSIHSHIASGQDKKLHTCRQRHLSTKLHGLSGLSQIPGWH